MQGLTVQEAAASTGWSPRMLRYLERVGLLPTPRSPSGYRVYGAAELQRLRTLRELLGRFDLGLSDVTFAKRLHDQPELAAAVAGWIDAWKQPRPPESVPTSDWLRFEQEKLRRLLAAAAA
jgi:MerR family copper efflux transcriptional regulator